MENEGAKDLTIISTPYRVGTHTSTMPTAFIPIIDQLVALHANNYVHGDIRAYNMVFGNVTKDGWLIDFDFSGPFKNTTYPTNYQNDLGDGSRLGKQNEMITKLNDWYALFSVIFMVHVWVDVGGMIDSGDIVYRYIKLQKYSPTKETGDDIPTDIIDELKKLLTDYEGSGGHFSPSERFSESLGDCCTGNMNTRGEGTGSPIK
jgi:hypothetical protein